MTELAPFLERVSRFMDDGFVDALADCAITDDLEGAMSTLSLRLAKRYDVKEARDFFGDAYEDYLLQCCYWRQRGPTGRRDPAEEPLLQLSAAIGWHLAMRHVAKFLGEDVSGDALETDFEGALLDARDYGVDTIPADLKSIAVDLLISRSDGEGQNLHFSAFGDEMERRGLRHPPSEETDEAS